MTTPPFIVNKLPASDATDVGLTQPIRFSVKDADTFIDAGQLRLTVGYALIHADGTHKFEDVLPRTSRSSTIFGSVDTNDQPTIAVVGGGIQITKTVVGNQQSTYFTKIDSGTGNQSVIATAVLTPSVSNSQPGAVFGIENGPRNTGVYVIFEKTGGGVKRIRMCGPINSSLVQIPNIIIAFDWTGTNRYTLIWNELRAKVELYAVVSGATSLLHEEPTSSFQTYDPIPGGTPHQGSVGDMTLVYGIEGTIGEQVTIGNVCITTDVGFPIIGITRPGEFTTFRRSDETIRYDGGNPLTATVSPWFGPDAVFFNNPDPAGAIRVLPSNAVRLSKVTSGKSLALYREEPSLIGSSTNGFMLEGNLFGVSEESINGIIAGFGFMIYDGQSVYFMTLMNGTPRQVGLLRSGSSLIVPASYQTADFDWSSPAYFRFAMDPRRAKLNMWANDLATPIMEIPFNRGALPSGSDFGLGSKPFVAFGHIADIATLGSFDLSRLIYACNYTSYEGLDGVLPDAIGTNPIWTRV